MDNTVEIKEFLKLKIQEAAREKGVAVKEVDESFDLFQSGVFDSMGFVSLIGAIENKFSIEMDFSELEPEDFSTLNGLGSVVAKGIGAR